MRFTYQQKGPVQFDLLLFRSDDGSVSNACCWNSECRVSVRQLVENQLLVWLPKVSSVSPNPSSLRVYVGMTVYIRIYTSAWRVCLCITMPICSLFFNLRLPLTFLSKAWSRQVYLYNVHIDANLQLVLKRPLKAGPCSDSKSPWIYQKFIHPIIDSFNAKREKKRFAGAEIVECSYY